MKFGIVTAVALMTAGLAWAQGSFVELRYLSFATRDQPPGADEARDFAAGKTLDQFLAEWMTSSGHEERIFRYFNDLFGISGDIFIAEQEFVLKKNADGAYWMDAQGHGNCAAGQAVAVPSTEVWWLDDGDPGVLMCPSTQNTFVSTGVWAQPSWRDCLERNASSGLFHPECGCGPKQILCWPEEVAEKVRDAVQFEFPNRGVYVYRNDLSWKDLLGGDKFYGNRLLYHVYLYQSRILPGRALGHQSEPTTADFARLKSLHLLSAAEGPGFVAMPDHPQLSTIGSLPVRSGIATMPGFMRQFNNMRSRVRALTERLLCEDVGPSQNTDGINTFVNPDLTDFDRSHGTQEGCAGCHYAMDNQGSMILGWDQLGTFQVFWDQTRNVVRSFNQLGHSFGLRSSGAQALMDSYLDHAPQFHACMAKRAWEEFSGQAWDGLEEPRRSALIEASRNGPRPLIRSVLESPEIRCPRSAASQGCQPISQSSPSVSFTSEIKPILDLSCSGSTCHSKESVLGSAYRFIDTEAAFRSINPARLLDGSMPPQGSGRVLSEAERTLLLNHLGR